MATTPEPAPRLVTGTGTSLCASTPHWRTVPSDFKANEAPLPPPAAIATTPDPGPRAVTGTGVGRFIVVPSPNWPPAFMPQPNTVPSDFRANDQPLPAAT